MQKDSEVEKLEKLMYEYEKLKKHIKTVWVKERDSKIKKELKKEFESKLKYIS